MNCKDALRLLYDVIDREADQLDVVEVEKHLKNCRHCMARYEFEKTFRTFVTEKGHNACDTSKVRQDILRKLDMIDAAGEVGVAERPFRFPVWKFAAAAVVILGIVGAFWAGTTWNRRASVDALIQAHHTGGDNATAVFTSGSGPLDFLYRQTGLRLEPSDKCPVDHIRSVAVDTIEGTVFGRINLVCDNGNAVTLFVASGDEFELPSGPQDTIDGCPWLTHCDSEHSVLGRTKNGVVYMVVAPADEPRETLTRMVNAF